MTRETVKRFAEDVVAPKVRDMDENEMMDKEIIKGLFEHGVSLVVSIGFSTLMIASPAHGYRDPR